MSIPFTKWHALQNDFLIIDARTRALHDLERAARALCDRRAGIGADGLLILERSDKAESRVRVFNADGSEAEISGNGLRCAAAHLLGEESGPGASISLETLAGVSGHVLQERAGQMAVLESRFPPATFPESTGCEPIELSVEAGIVPVHVVSVGNPHAVLLEGWSASNWLDLGPQIENHSRFPERTNVEFVSLRGEGELVVLVWERGAGRTASSGTGASAAFAVARKRGIVGSEATVILEGGNLNLRESEGGFALAGPCERVFDGNAPLKLWMDMQ